MLHQTTGLPYTVTADAVRHTAAEAAALATPNRLAWCLRETTAGVRLVEVLPSVHRAGCPRPHVLEHECPEATPPGRRPQGALR
ncbi:hypothetical protein [Streptomyces malaysiensis]|uniref:hypothetical protein n=1 Tax=Streptomyces malaysiensis TaxID=92644 RepID=UPI001C2E807A|nr:hypothetical protein [Streptomyces samsunensis]